LFRRDPEELDEQEREQLALLFDCTPDLKHTYNLRKELTDIFEANNTKESRTAAI
jgi:hypothetical protein